MKQRMPRVGNVPGSGRRLWRSEDGEERTWDEVGRSLFDNRRGVGFQSENCGFKQASNV